MNTLPTNLVNHQQAMEDEGRNGSPTSKSPLGSVPPLPGETEFDSPAQASHGGKSSSRKRNRFWWIALSVLLLGSAIGLTAVFNRGSLTDRPELLLHTVKFENLELTVVERGTLESSRNVDVVCKVKASKGGSFNIKTIVDNGTHVKKDQLIVTLDDAALLDQQRTQIIALTIAQAADTKASSDLKSIVKENEEALLKAVNALRGAELDIEKYIGLPRGTMAEMDPEKRKTHIRELEKSLEAYLTRHGKEFITLDGEFRQLLDDVNGRIELAEAEYEQWKDKTSYSQRMVIKGYVTQSQAQADESRLNSATENLKKLRTERRLLITFTAQKAVQNFCSALKETELALERTRIQCDARSEQAQSELKSKGQILEQETLKLRDIEEQISLCKIHAPQEGLVVYYTSEQSRFGSGSQQSIIAQGEPVREGQKLMRIPDLTRMQVVARIHEATIARIKADGPRSRGAIDLINWRFLPDILLLREDALEDILMSYFSHHNTLTTRGQPASIRVDAFNDKPLRGHVKSKDNVASQDFFSSDVKVYQTVVSIDQRLDGLRPGMSAEVTIQVENPLENVLAVPLQAIIGGPEQGDKRKVYVMTGSGPTDREIRVGLSNDKMAEIRDGLQEGDQVILNPKALLGDKAKTRDPADSSKAAPKGKKKSEKGEGSAAPKQ